jgi:hypothetical protein
MSEPSPEQSFFSIHLKSLTDFADEFTTQIQSLQSPMDHLATMSVTAPQYGAFHEAWSLGAGEQAAVEEMFSLLGQVKTAIGFAGDVTGTVAEGYRNADENIAYGLGGPPAGYGGNSGSGSWSSGHQDSGHHTDGHHHDPYQNDQGNQHDQGHDTPVHTPAPGPWVPNQNTSGPFAGTPFTAVPVAGALLGGALLAGAAKSKSHQPQGNTSVNVSVEVDGASGQAGALPLWTPPPDPGAGPGMSGAIPSAPAPATPVFPGQDAPWTAASPQGGTRP